MNAVEIGPGLWRWVAYHEEWKEDVGCLYVETDESVCLIDPLVPADEWDAFLRHLDADVARAGLPVHVLLTVYWHVRSTPRSSSGTARRSGRRRAACSPSPGASASTRNRCVPAMSLRAGSRRMRRAARRRWSSSSPRTEPSLPGTCSSVARSGSARPAGSEKAGSKAVREALRPLVRPSLRVVIPSHGDAVVVDAERVLAEALA